MGAQVGNTRLAGDAAARLRHAASEGIQMRRAALKNKKPTTGGDNTGMMDGFKSVSLPASESNF